MTQGGVKEICLQKTNFFFKIHEKIINSAIFFVILGYICSHLYAGIPTKDYTFIGTTEGISSACFFY